MDIELNSTYEVRSNILQPNLLEGAGKSQGNSFIHIYQTKVLWLLVMISRTIHANIKGNIKLISDFYFNIFI